MTYNLVPAGFVNFTAFFMVKLWDQHIYVHCTMYVQCLDVKFWIREIEISKVFLT